MKFWRKKIWKNNWKTTSKLAIFYAKLENRKQTWDNKKVQRHSWNRRAYPHSTNHLRYPCALRIGIVTCELFKTKGMILKDWQIWPKLTCSGGRTLPSQEDGVQSPRVICDALTKSDKKWQLILDDSFKFEQKKDENKFKFTNFEQVTSFNKKQLF